MFRCYFRSGGSWFSWVAAIALVLQPCVALAAPLAQRHPAAVLAAGPISVADIALSEGGVLRGQIVNSAGAGVAVATVDLSNGQQHWQTKTDANGWFQIDNLRGGTFRLQTAEQSQVFRLWAVGTAPPSACKGVLVAAKSDVVRGQRVVSPYTNQFFRVAKQRLANPWVVGGIVATAVAIPVGIHNADDDNPPATP